ncbi:MAG: hypothetical protein AAB424_02375 [Patescibacteria group bacterium]
MAIMKAGMTHLGRLAKLCPKSESRMSGSMQQIIIIHIIPIPP